VRIRALLLAIVTLMTGACAATGIKLSEAQRCAESGGTWFAAMEHCEQSSGGSGGY
jgi:hypothetical protein